MRRKQVPRVPVYAHPAGDRRCLHPGGDVYCIAPDIVLVLSPADNTGDHLPNMDPNTHSPVWRELSRRCNHFKATSGAMKPWVFERNQQARSSHKRIANRLDLFEIMLNTQLLECLH